MPQSTCEKVTPKLDLARFYGMDHPHLLTNPQLFDNVRRDFAEEIVSLARRCQTNKEVIDALFAAIRPESGLCYPRFMGNGSNRDVFLLPFAMVLKMERPWTILDTRAAKKAGQYPFWYQNRRHSHFNELIFACSFPRTFVRIFGASLAFGHRVDSPPVLITERAAPLDTLISFDLSDEDAVIEGFDNENMWIDQETGELKIFDSRFDGWFTKRRWKRDGLCMKEVNNHAGGGLSMRNVGLCQDGKVRLIDAGGIVTQNMRMDRNMLPKQLAWADCWDGSPQHIQQSDAISDQLMEDYRVFAAKAQQKGGTENG
jgi:hypothetical protein